MENNRPIKIVLEEYEDSDYYLMIRDDSLGLGKTIALKDLLLSICKSFSIGRQMCLSPYFTESIDPREIFISKLFNMDKELFVEFLNERLADLTFEGRPIKLAVSKLSTKMKFKVFDLVAFIVFLVLMLFFMIALTRNS